MSTCMDEHVMLNLIPLETINYCISGRIVVDLIIFPPTVMTTMRMTKHRTKRMVNRHLVFSVILFWYVKIYYLCGIMGKRDTSRPKVAFQAVLFTR